MSTTVSGTSLQSEPVGDSLCLISGYLLDLTGAPLRGWNLVIRNGYDSMGSAPDTVFLRERVNVQADQNGFVQFALRRGVRVDVELPNRLFDHVLHCTVPSRGAADLVDFLFPHVISLAFTTASPTALAVGDGLEVEAAATLSNGEVVALDGASATYASSDSAVLQQTSGPLFEALATGSVTVSMTAFDPEPLGLLTQPDGTVFQVLERPTPALPASITVNVA